MIDTFRLFVRAAVALALLSHLWTSPVAAVPHAYVSDFAADTVTVIDTATATVVATVPVGPGPLGVAVNWAGTRAYVGNRDGTVSVIRTDTNVVVATVPAGDVNRGIAVNPAGTRVYVASAGVQVSAPPPGTNTFPGVVTVIDATLNTVVTTVAVSPRPFGVAVSPDGQRAYVAGDDGTVTVIDATANTVLTTITMDTNPVTIFTDSSPSGGFTTYTSNGGVTAGVAVNPAGTRVYVTSPASNRIVVVDTLTNTVVDSIPTGIGPTGVALNAAGTRLYVTNRFSRTVSVFDTATHALLQTLLTEDLPFGLAVTPDGQKVYLGNTSFGAVFSVSGFVSVIDTTAGTEATVIALSDPEVFGRFIRPADTTTRLEVVAPAAVAAGSPFALTVTARDQFGNVATGYTGTVHFTRSDPGAGSAVPADYTFVGADGGVKTFSSGATFVTAGNQTLTATDTGNASITGTSNSVMVSPLAATHFSVVAPATAVAGTPFAFTVSARDQFDNVATSYTGTVQFTKSDAGTGSAVPASYTFLPADSGAKTFIGGATLVTPGNRTLTATDIGNATITGTSNSIVVNAAAATHFSVVAPATAVAGTPFNVSVTALDQFNNTATGYAGTVHFTSTDAAATLPADATLTNGVRVFSVTLKTVGNRTLTATDTVAPAVSGTSPAITVTAVKTVSGPSATGSGMITATLSGGGAGCTFAAARFIALSGDPGSPPAGSAPAGVDFPHGLFDFTTTGCTPGSTITLAVTYPAPLAPGTSYWKYGPRPGPIAAGWYLLPSTIAGNTVTFSITDGQIGDDDLVANGTIVDQGGPGAPVPIPTLSEAAMLLLAALLSLVGVWTLKRSRPALVALLALALGVAPAAAETLGGFCRQAGSTSILPITIDVDPVTGVATAQALSAASLGADRAGHFASALRPDVPGSRLMVTGLRSAATGPESLVTVDLQTGAVQAVTCPAGAFAGRSLATIPSVTPWTVLMTQDATQVFDFWLIGGVSAAPGTRVRAVDVASGTVTSQVDVFYATDGRPARDVARVFFDVARPTVAWLLQPCNLVFLQQLVRLDTTTTPFTVLSTIDLVADFCVHAPGLVNNRLFALGEDGSLGTTPQLTRINTNTGTVTPFGTAVEGFRRTEASPYAYSTATSRLYALDAAQTSLATWNLLTGAHVMTPFTVPAACAPAGITSLAGALP